MKVVLISIAVLLAVILLAVGGFKLYDYIGAAEFYNNSEKVFKTPGVNDSNFVPQGMTYDEGSNTFFFTGYMGKPILGKLGDDVASRVYFMDGDGSVGYASLCMANGEPYTDHTGGVEVFDKYVYVTGEDSHGLDVFLLSDILDGGKAVMQGTVKTYNSPAHCYTFDGGNGKRYILAGSYHKDETVYLTPEHEKIAIPRTDEKNPSVMTVFELDANAEFGVLPDPVAIISAREMIQGICMTPEGQLVVSSSWGLATSNLYFYDMADFTLVENYNYAGQIAYGDLEDVNAEKTYEDFNFTVPCYVIDSHDPEKTVVAPPMSEELVCRDGMIIVFCESACNKYMFGKLTTGFNTYGYKYK
ncbi:MAG: hypothetical protein IKA84_00690 [Clostridia bacterium]|nr:hypothetical protein [Clostridia bacterium]